MWDELVPAHELAYSYATEAAPAGVTVETAFEPDSGESIPLLIVGASSPVASANGPSLVTANFSISLSMYAHSAAESMQLCRMVVEGFHRLWRTRFTTDAGWITHIHRDSLQPQLVTSDLESSDSYRATAVLNVTARR